MNMRRARRLYAYNRIAGWVALVFSVVALVKALR